MNTPSASSLRSLLLSAVLCSGGLASGCSTLPRAPAPLATAASAAPVGFPARVRFLGIDPESLDRRSGGVVAAVRNAADGGPVNVLALSGGGAGGAFGAGHSSE